MSVPYTKQVAYIESTGTQYIDTGFKPNQDTRVICSFEQITTRNIAAPFGCESPRYSAYIISSKFRFDYNSTMTSTQIQVENNIQHEIDFNKNNVYVDGTLNTTFTYGNFTAPNLLLFRTTYGGSNFYGRIYWCKVYDNGVLVRDFIPVRVNETGYLYDKVSGELFGNAGSGNFVLGNDYVYYSRFLPFRRRLMMVGNGGGELPAGYSFCDYIDLKTNFNKNQHIDTRFKPNEDSRCVIDFIVFERGSSVTNVVLFGCQTPRFACAIDYAGISIRGDYNNTVGTAVSGYLALGVRGIADLNKNKFYYNDNLLQTFNYTTFNTNRNLWIGALNGYDNVGGNFYIYSCQIYDNDVLVRDYHPCVDGNNVGYLWDGVNKKIYSFAYTGAIGGYDS